jgi:hypothetical protein
VRSVDFPDGSSRERLGTPPDELLKQGPIWVTEKVSGRRLVCGSGAVVDGAELVVLDGEIEVARIFLDQIDFYEHVTVVDPDGMDPFGRRLWDGVPAGAELLLVWIQQELTD